MYRTRLFVATAATLALALTGAEAQAQDESRSDHLHGAVGHLGASGDPPPASRGVDKRSRQEACIRKTGRADARGKRMIHRRESP